MMHRCSTHTHTCGLDDVLGTGLAPLDLGGVELVGHVDDVTIDDKLSILYSDGSRVLAVDSVVLKDIKDSLIV